MRALLWRDVVMVTGALVLSGVIWLIWGVPGVAAFSYVSTPKYESNGTLYFAVPADSKAVHATVQVDKVSPKSSNSVALKMVLEIGKVDNAHWNTPSIVLTGSFTQNLKSCWAESGSVPARETNLRISGTDRLTPFESALVEDEMASPDANGALTSVSQDKVQQAVADKAEKLTFTRITPASDAQNDNYTSGSWSQTDAQGTKTSYDTFTTTVTCSFTNSAFWKTFGDNKVFNFPSVVVGSGNQESTGVSVGLERDVNIPEVSSVKYTGSTSGSTQTSGNLRNFTNHWFWSGDAPASARLVASGFSATYIDVDGDATRQSQILWAGLAGGVIASLLIAVAKTVVDLIYSSIGRRVASTRQPPA